jgi:pimeloyl-ACP methyl ester carboxylesterase
MLLDVRPQQEKLDSTCILTGSVSAARKDARPLVVVLFRQDEGGERGVTRGWHVVDHFALEQPGRWGFGTGPGRYALAAFEDRSRDLVYQPGEAYGSLGFDQPIACTEGARLTDLVLAVPLSVAQPFPHSLDIGKLQARKLEDQVRATIGQLTATGELAALSDARFSEANAESGLWRPFDFLVTARAGIYFLEPYDPRRVPVLFVHGVNGTPVDFEYLAGRIDRARFQPWVYYYPSGMHLDIIAGHLEQTMAKLQARYRFERYAVVAHSMGGLVSRGFLQKAAAHTAGGRVPLFVSLSTPWGGHRAAEIGVKKSPVVVRVWEDMAPGSEYQRGLYSKPLPSGMKHHLLFTFSRKSASFGESDDQTVSVASQLLPQAQRDAFKLYGFDHTHMGVLRDPEVSQLLNELLAGAY